MAADPPPGFLCHSCAKDSGIDPFKRPTAPKKRKATADKRDIVHFEGRRLPTLAALCIEVGVLLLILLDVADRRHQLVSRHIDDIEALGDIGSLKMDEISKALAKNRSL